MSTGDVDSFKIKIAKGVLNTVFADVGTGDILTAIPYLRLIKATTNFLVDQLLTQTNAPATAVTNANITTFKNYLNSGNTEIKHEDQVKLTSVLTELKTFVNTHIGGNNDEFDEEYNGDLQEGGHNDELHEDLELTENLDSETRYEKQLYEDYKQKYKLLKQQLKSN